MDSFLGTNFHKTTTSKTIKGIPFLKDLCFSEKKSSNFQEFLFGKSSSYFNSMFSFEEANSYQFWTVFFTNLLPISAKFVFGMLLMMLHQKTQKEKTVQSCHLTIVVCKEGHLTPPCCSHVASFEISNFNSYGVLCRRGII
jgi:hypothetical protein